MLPIFSAQDTPQPGACDTEFSANVSAVPPFIVLPDPQHVAFREFRRMMRFSAMKAAFNRGIPAIVTFGSQEQMVGPQARRVIASMEDAESSWDIAVMKYPRNTMRSDQFPIPPDFAVPFSVVGAFKHPAFVGFFDLRPQSFLDWNTWSNHGTHYNKEQN